MSLLKATTILSRSLDEILPALTSLLATPHKTRLFALSTNNSDAALSRLTGLLSNHPSSVGCLSTALPSYPNHIACSVSLWDDSVTVFRSTIPGKEEVQVGRWHSFRKKEASDDIGKHEVLNPVKWDDVWAQNTKTNELPEELASLDPNLVQQVLFLSDSAHEGLSNSLSRHLPQTSKLGLLATSTVFTTGRPFTLIHNQAIHSAGAVGIAISHPSSLAGKINVNYHNLKAITPPLTVTRTEGNLVLSLDKTNPTAILLAAIKQSGLDRVMNATGLIEHNEKFYVGVVGGGVGATGDQITETYPIISGDPARGPIALLSDRAPAEGCKVQFFHRTSGHMSDLAETRRRIGFVATAEAESLELADLDDVVVMDNTFLAASENGFIVEDGCGGAWRCTVPDAVGSWEY